jgi:Protein of unknown function (DUF4019)
MRKKLLCVIGTGFLMVSIGSCSKDKTTAAKAAAGTWLKLVDSGNYAQSWDQAANLMKTSVAKEQWQQILDSNRAPLGSLISRRLTSAQYREELPGAPAGHYVVLRYDSTFEHRNSVTETAAPTLDKDGTWRVSLYYIK